jgi:hypothetical protein
MTTLAQLSDSQVSPEVVINEVHETLSYAGIFGKRHAATSGLTWGYYGGLWRSLSVANDAVTLTDDTTNYVVAERATGIVSVATATTDWDDSAYARLYKLTTASGLVTVEEDHRAGSLFGASATGVSSVNGQTGAVTVEAIVHAATGKTTPVDADEFGIVDSAASNVLKKLTWANLKATLKAYLDTVHAAIGAITGSGLTMATGRLLGRTTASTGAVEEITVGSGLSLSAGTLAVDTGTMATKAYADGLVSGLSWKQAVRAATTVNGNLATSFENGDTVDGVTLATGDRILIKNQTTGSENGIYIVAASGTPARASDADSGAELVNASVYVSEGTTNADTQWTCTTNATITVGSTSIAFAQVSAGSVAIGSVTGMASGAATFLTTPSSANLAALVTDESGTGALLFAGGALGTPSSGTLTNCTGLPVAGGGTGASTAAGARANLQVGQTVLAVACSDESTALTTGTNKVKFINPYGTAFNVTAVVASLSTAQTSGSIFTVDINEAGTSILSTKLTIDNTETNSSTAATPAVISDASIAAYAEIEVDIDQVGDGTAKGLKVYLIGYPS